MIQRGPVLLPVWSTRLTGIRSRIKPEIFAEIFDDTGFTWHGDKQAGSVLGCGRLFIQPALRIQRRHATKTGRSDGLAIDMIGHVASRKNAGDTGCSGITFGAAFDFDVAALHLKLSGKNS